MTFTTPLALAGLLAVPVLIFWYVRRQRGRARDRAAFVLPALMPSVAPDRPGWRRHAPMLAFARRAGRADRRARRPAGDARGADHATRR